MTRLHAEVEIEVAFFDVDAMEVVWHGHYVKYLEHARTALLRSFDYDYPQMRASGYLWPIVELNLKYVRSCRYGQRLKIRAELMEYENRIKIAYLISDATTGEKLTKAWTVQVAVDARSGELQLVSPPILLSKLKEAGK